MSPRRFSSAQRSGSMPVSRTISDDLPWSTWPAVATTRSAACGAASVLVDVVTLEGVLDRAREVGELVREHGPHVEQRRVGLRPDRTPTGCRRAAGPRTPPDPPSSRATPHDGIVVPGIDPPPTTDWHLRTCAPSRSPSSDSASRCARFDRSSSGSRSIRRTGSSSSRPDACIARTASSAAICILSTRTARAIGCARSLATQVGASDDDPGLRSAEQLVARARHQVGAVGERLGHRRLVRRHAVLVMQQPGADVEDERHAALRGERGEVLGRR